MSSPPIQYGRSAEQVEASRQMVISKMAEWTEVWAYYFEYGWVCEKVERHKPINPADMIAPYNDEALGNLIQSWRFPPPYGWNPNEHKQAILRRLAEIGGIQL